MAAAAGLAMVYSVPSLRMQHGLTRFLERLAAEAAAGGPVGGGGFRGVPLCVVPDQARALELISVVGRWVATWPDRRAHLHARCRAGLLVGCICFSTGAMPRPVDGSLT